VLPPDHGEPLLAVDGLEDVHPFVLENRAENLARVLVVLDDGYGRALYVRHGFGRDWPSGSWSAHPVVRSARTVPWPWPPPARAGGARRTAGAGRLGRDIPASAFGR